VVTSAALNISYYVVARLKMSTRKCIFSDSLKQKFPFIKQSSVGGDSSKVACELYHAVFSVSQGEKEDIIDHVSTKNIRLMCLQKVAVSH
jgi:hypothetical protein